jgi:hypothetical protein
MGSSEISTIQIENAAYLIRTLHPDLPILWLLLQLARVVSRQAPPQVSQPQVP